MSTKQLLPKETDDFRSKEYWKRFFEERGGKAFEWYSSFANIAPALRAELPSNDVTLLIPGCGNSDLSEQIYNAGYKSVTSTDFDSGVIDEMRKKTAKRCPTLKWAVGDVRSMEFPAGSFDAVVDKGLLDAMMPSTATEVTADVFKMLSECARCLKPGGVHIVVTLAQDHVLRCLLQWAAGAGNAVNGQPCSPYESCSIATITSQDATSPLCPFFIALRKKRDGASASAPAALSVRSPVQFSAGGSSTSISGGGKAGKKGKASKADPSSSPLSSSGQAAAEDVHSDTLASNAAIDAAVGAVHRVQWRYLTWRQLSNVTGDTHLELDLWPAPAAAGGDGLGSATIAAVTPAGDAPDGQPQGAKPRYCVTVVDAGSASMKPRAAVLLVPQGREHEFSFASKEGQAALAKQAGVDRLIFVTMHRGHAFKDTAEVQAELNPVVLTMVPEACAKEGSMPYLAVADDIGSRAVVAEGSSAMSGPWVVEDVLDDDANDAAEGGGDKKKSNKQKPSAKESLKPKRLLRRLVFMSNRNAIQSEAAVTAAPPAASASGAWSASSPAVTFDHSNIRFPYHAAMSASLGLLRQATPPGQQRISISVIGLGGGGLPMHIATSFPWAAVTSVELDPAMVDIARQHFGLAVDGEPVSLDAYKTAVTSPEYSEPSSGAVRVIVGDGLEYIKWMADPASTLPAAVKPGVIIVDVDAKDMRTGLSFPPAPFVARPFLKALHAAVVAGGDGGAGSVCGGMVMINVGCRSKPLYNGVLAAIGNEFGRASTATVPTGDADGDLNCVVLAGPGAKQVQGGSKAMQSTALQLYGSNERRVEDAADWLRAAKWLE